MTLIAFTFFSFIAGWILGRCWQCRIHADRTRAERALERQQRTVTVFDRPLTQWDFPRRGTVHTERLKLVRGAKR